MRIIKNILLFLLALALIASTGIFILFQTLDTDQYLPQIVQKASFVLGRPVSIGHLGLGLSLRGVSLDAGPLIVADDPEFTAQPFIKIERVRVSFDLKFLILQHKLRVATVILQSPQIHFIRSEDGNINSKSIFRKGHLIYHYGAKETIDSNIPVSPNTQVIPEATPVARNNAVNAQTMIIQDAAISFIDQSQSMPLDIWLKGINATVSNFSPSRPFRFTFDAALLSKSPNVHTKVLLTWDPSKRAVGISDLSLHMDLSRLDVDQLNSISPVLINDPMMKDMAGVVQLNVSHFDLAPSGDVEANGDVTITNGMIKNFNIVKAVLSRALGAFGIGGTSVGDLLGGQLKEALGKQDTVIENARAQFSLHDNALFIDDSLIKTNIFELSAKGSMDRGLKVDMQTMLHLNADVSSALVNELDGLKYLCDDSGRISIGASLQGVAPHLKYKPNKDFRKKSRKAMMKEGMGLLKLFFK